jgi:Kdo2-lipid IVA lauroyltransferase/acyltransferase
VNEFFARVAIFLIESTRNWSQPARTRLANTVGDLLWVLVASRRRVTLANLRACFPQWTEDKRHTVARQTVRNMARAVFDHSVLARGSRETCRSTGSSICMTPPTGPSSWWRRTSSGSTRAACASRWN